MKGVVRIRNKTSPTTLLIYSAPSSLAFLLFLNALGFGAFVLVIPSAWPDVLPPDICIQSHPSDDFRSWPKILISGLMAICSLWLPKPPPQTLPWINFFSLSFLIYNVLYVCSLYFLLSVFHTKTEGPQWVPFFSAFAWKSVWHMVGFQLKSAEKYT